MSAYTFMKALHDAIPEKEDWKQSPLPHAIFAIEGLRHAINLTGIHYHFVVHDAFDSTTIDKQLEQIWNSTNSTLVHIDSSLASLCTENQSRLLITDNWIRDAKEGFIADFKLPYAKLGYLLNSIKGQHTRLRNLQINLSTDYQFPPIKF